MIMQSLDVYEGNEPYLFISYSHKDQQAMLGLFEKCYALQCKALGEEHPDTLTSLNNLASTYGKLGEHKKALELNEKCHTLRCKVLG